MHQCRLRANRLAETPFFQGYQLGVGVSKESQLWLSPVRDAPTRRIATDNNRAAADRTEAIPGCDILIG